MIRTEQVTPTTLLAHATLIPFSAAACRAAQRRQRLVVKSHNRAPGLNLAARLAAPGTPVTEPTSCVAPTKNTTAPPHTRRSARPPVHAGSLVPVAPAQRSVTQGGPLVVVEAAVPRVHVAGVHHLPHLPDQRLRRGVRGCLSAACRVLGWQTGRVLGCYFRLTCCMLLCVGIWRQGGGGAQTPPETQANAGCLWQASDSLWPTCFTPR